MKKLISILGTSSIIFGGVVADNIINPYTDNGVHFEKKEISKIKDAGENKVLISKDKPRVDMIKLDGEARLGITYKDITANGNRGAFSNKIEWNQGNEKMEVLPLSDSRMEDGGYKINIILADKPNKNKFDFTIDSPGLKLEKTIRLWEEIGLKSPNSNCNDTFCTWSDGTVTTMEEDFVGSIVVYGNKKNHIQGNKNYSTGKLFTIYRPKIVDAIGNYVWGELDYKNGVLTVIVPQSFLNTASYPVNVDPTFGYTTIGGSTITLGSGGTTSNIIAGVGSNYAYTATAGNTVTALNVYMKAAGGTASVDLGVYTYSSSLPQNLVGSASTLSFTNTTEQWNSISVSTALTNGTTYTIAMGNYVNGTTASTFYRDLLGGTNNSQAAAGALPSTWTPTTGSGSTYSLYATYSVSSNSIDSDLILFE